MSPALVKSAVTIISGIAGSVSGVLVAQEPRTLTLTIWAVALASLSTGLLGWVHAEKPGTKAKIDAARRASTPPP